MEILSWQVFYAIMLTFFAGASSAIGALIAFFSYANNTRFLSFGLGFSAGVMIYIAFVEILPSSLLDFKTYSKDFGEINEKLRDLGVKVVVKLHPLQDLDQYKTMDLDHFVLLSHQEFVRRKMDLYKFMAQSDALITDYSSIFIDYLLLDRPIAFTEDDMDDYTRGFVFDNPKSYQPGFRIKTKEDFLAFAESLVNGDDDYKSERKRVMALANDYHDGKFCKRALECVGINL